MALDIYRESLKLFNSEAKSHFMESVDLEESSKRNMFYTLKRIDKYLKKFEKDIYQLTADEIEDIMYSCRFKTKMSARVFYYNIMTYANWAKEEGYIGSYLPKFTEASNSEYFDKYVSKIMSNYYTQDELFDLYESLTNPQDMLILQCAFEGIRGKSNSEIINLSMEDTFEEDDTYYVNLFDTEKGTERLKFEISDYLYNLMKFVNNMIEVEDGRGINMELIPSKYILKRTYRGKGANKTENTPVNNTFIMNRMFALKAILQENKFRIKDIEKSGVMHYLNEILNTEQGRLTTVDNSILTKISDKFNLGKYIQSDTGEEYIHYLVVKNMIDEKWFKTTYGEVKF